MRTANVDNVRAMLRIEIDKHTAQAQAAEAEAAHLTATLHRATVHGLATSLQLLEEHSVFTTDQEDVA